MTTSLRTLSLHCALALAAAIATAGPGSARAATHPPVLASDTGWPSELVNRPSCVSDGGHETYRACEAGRH